MAKVNTFTSKEKAIEEVTRIAKAEEGYLEKKSNENLYSKTANAGYNNYTKYWADLAKAGVMGQSSTFAGGPAWYWCAGFITWIFMKAFGINVAKKILLHMPYTSCANLGDLAKKAGRLKASPKIGDIVLFWNGSRFSHTGFVYDVNKTTFYTVEGNTNSSKSVVANGGSVCLKSYSISTYKKKGAKFFRPDYSIAVEKTNDSKDDKPPIVKPAITKNKTVIVNTKNGTLNCRKKASSLSPVVGKFKKNTELTLVEKTDKNWWKVKGRAMSGALITGYCSTRYLKEK